jgi:hypothetical protein
MLSAKFLIFIVDHINMRSDLGPRSLNSNGKHDMNTILANLWEQISTSDTGSAIAAKGFKETITKPPVLVTVPHTGDVPVPLESPFARELSTRSRNNNAIQEDVDEENFTASKIGISFVVEIGESEMSQETPDTRSVSHSRRGSGSWSVSKDKPFTSQGLSPSVMANSLKKPRLSTITDVSHAAVPFLGDGSNTSNLSGRASMIEHPMAMLLVTPQASMKPDRLSSIEEKKVSNRNSDTLPTPEDIDFGHNDPEGFGWNLESQESFTIRLWMEERCLSAGAAAVELMLRNVDTVFGFNTFTSAGAPNSISKLP